MEYISIPVIVVICYLIGEACKIFLKKKSYKFIPIIVGICGGIIGVICYYISPELLLNIHSPVVALAAGMISGLASTGGNQILKQMTKENRNDNS